jgi:hypothetical protein
MLTRRYLCIFSFVLLAACGGGEAPKPEAKKEPPKPPEPVTGRYAFHQMYAAARSWATDLQPLQVTSIPLKEIEAKDGKYPAWQCVFVSPSKQLAKTYLYSVIDADGGINKGVYGRNEERWNAASQIAPFPLQALKIDTDAALQTALAKGKGDEYAKKNPDKPIVFTLEKIKRFPNPAWRVIWGTSVSTSNFSVYVDASSGDYLQTMR